MKRFGHCITAIRSEHQLWSIKFSKTETSKSAVSVFYDTASMKRYTVENEQERDWDENSLAADDGNSG